MITVLETSIFREWLVSIKDLATRLRLARRLEKAQRGNLGDIKQLANFLVLAGECTIFIRIH